MSQLQYHQAIFNLLGIDPIVSEERQSWITERESICGHPFPAAVTEWMSVPGVEDIFCENTDGSYIPHIVDSSKATSRHWLLGQPEDTQNGYLCVACENQCVVKWYVRLDEGNDPPVYHDYGLAGEKDAPPLSEIPWTLVSRTYSDFIYHMVTPKNRVSVCASDREPNMDERERLSERFVQAVIGAPVPQWIIPHTEINMDPKGCIQIYPLSGSELKFWCLEADSPEVLQKLIEGVWDIANLAQTIEGDTEEEQSIIKRVRESHPQPDAPP